MPIEVDAKMSADATGRHGRRRKGPDMKIVARLFLKGLVIVIPLAITLYVIFWIGRSAESAARETLRSVLGIETYVPGMGIAGAALLVIGIGVLTEFWIVRKLIAAGESLILKVPLVKSIYGGLRDLMSFVSSVSGKDEKGKVVMVELAEDLRLLGFVTRETFDDLPEGMGSKEDVLVYLPMSYQIGGFTLAVPRGRIESLDMSAENAMRFALTAGMSRTAAEDESIEERLGDRDG
jgi:uncharacterized membrane protein